MSKFAGGYNCNNQDYVKDTIKETYRSINK